MPSLSKSLSGSSGHSSQPSAIPSKSVSILSSYPGHWSTSPQTPSSSESFSGSSGHSSTSAHNPSSSISSIQLPSQS